MTTPANTARSTKRWKAQIGENEFQGHTSAIDYNPNYTGSSWKGGDNNTLSEVTPGDPTIALTMAQDTENADSLWRLFHDSPAGTPLTLIWYPHYDGTFALSVDLKTLKPQLVTNRSGGIPEVTLTLPCSEAVTYLADEPEG
ncbi:hypothetical protein [Microbacterium sp. TNHR37B]|uniref:hypothetical protein n=1 Tax=Microbacterium sp. TNHR37B TaxID=1775956 RepID=UPI0007B1C3ED|nr:hypothetical protein [Microbacterium sp. TNHR37B]KZE91180.1 hypothetical protein AVP41_00715 [Microbacterium sp. TNHR37B]